MIRDLTKSMLSFSWAMSLFGAEQLTNMLLPQKPSQPNHRATAAFSAVTQATEEQLGSVLKGVFKAGDQLQKGMVDLTFSFLSLEAFNPSQMMRMTSDVMRQTTGAVGQGLQKSPSGPQPPAGWEPMSATTPSRSQPPAGREPMSATTPSRSQSPAGWGPVSAPGISQS